ncbi:hypothetical protein MtrunA17_Chr7g0252571 [Medicago truncatula]|uniref:DUF761 domain protein n=1 Tax=Medicago truncatula TaxID=3880 RepID=Q2HRV2_MEDTR|nr:uncharacterized protein LOC11431449 [Medicago truncatula]ABD33171.1 hypothetical protein MtrDRAFT_AC157890g20v2 [Medicago truncatula]AES80760.1 DUF761 domain protein [Medicago truncatula]RHN47400.1 hypothetical protein MtrunA17_Chr7g0252571 [Medicago truncatula]
MSNMKNKTANLLKQIIADLTSMTKSKTMSLKSKTNTIKARSIILSVMNKKFLMSSISEKFHSVWGSHSHHHFKEDCLIEEGGNFDDHNKALVVYNNKGHSYEALRNPSETQVVDEQQDQGDGYDSYYGYGDDDGKYPDLTHTLFDFEGLDFDGSVIDKVKICKEEAGKEFKLEDDIDEVADLFIRRFKRNIILQKQDSLRRRRETVQKGT